MRFRRFGVWALLVYGSLLLQSTVLARLTFFGAKPDILLVLVVLTGVLQGKEAAAQKGFFIGLFEDLFLARFLGVNALTKAALGYLTGMVEKEVFKENIVISVMMVWVFSLFHAALYALLMILLGRFASLGLDYLGTILPFAFYNAMIAGILFPLMYALLVKGPLRRKKADSMELFS